MKGPDQPFHPRHSASGRPAFEEPWHAEALGVAATLSRSGLFTAAEWSEALGVAVRDASARGEPENDGTYYGSVLAALESLLAARSPDVAADLAGRTEAWRRAYLNTPHGRPVELAAGLAPITVGDDDDHDDDHDHHHGSQPVRQRAGASGKGRMKITSVKTAASRGHCMHIWVKIETDAGITGLGECVHGGHAAIALIQNDFAPMLVGEDPFAVDALFERLRRRRVFEGGFAGALITALTGIEIALWDLKGKALGVPVYELLGGKFRDRIRVYADCEVAPGMNFDEVKTVVDHVLGRGFTALKVDLDIGAYDYKSSEVAHFHKDDFNMTAGEWEHDRMVKIAEMVTKAAGETVDVACDVHTRLDVPSAKRLAKDLEQFHLLWLEEPVPPENVDAMREVKRSTTTPICAGENLYLRQGYRELLEKQAVDIIMPDIPKCGGLSECRKIANLAELYYIPFAPHNVSSPIGTMASAHVCATIPNFLVLEYHWLYRDYWTTIITSKEDIIQDGWIALTDRPGIGVDLDEEVARQHQYPGTTWFE